MINRLKSLFQKRNLAISTLWEAQLEQPIYSNMTIHKATKEGYRSNANVYRCVFLITKAASGIPWMVQNKDGEDILDHHLSKLLAFPNPALSREDMFELLISWLELSGNAYLNKVKIGGRTSELWPISPDRLAPIPSKDLTEWLKGYSLDNSRKVDFDPQDIIAFRLFNPSNPLIGISPLEAVGKTVDVDNDMINFNKSTMQNKGEISGIWAFKQAFSSQDQADAIAEKLNERYAGTKKMAVLGSEATYTRTALTPVELDFATSLRTNREAIAMAFGVPVVYLGDTGASTYANFQSSEMIFYIQTIIPLLDDVKDALNFSLKDELGVGETIEYDISNVPAMREALYSKVETAKIMHNMGVPFSKLNALFSFSVDEFDGWDESHVTGTGAAVEPDSGARTEKKKAILRLLRHDQQKATGS